ncbi:unnamed protein product [Rotaria sp. Silwood1]|nr:unnamed protein product [Rotaria sp. Silwood1]CAF1629897.1 unnamed protein product [Rotaria sp. Silwood1]
MTEVIKIGRKSRLLWIKAADDPSAAEWERIFDGYDATVDWPAARFWKTLIQYYPDAKVILNVRDAEKWYDSVKNTIYKLAGTFPDGTTVYKGSVPPAMTTDAVNYLRDGNVKMFQVSETKTYPNLANLYFGMRKEFHTWHYSGGKLLTGCWTGVTVYQYINHP